MDQDDDQQVVRKLIEAVISTHKNDPKFERLMLYAALEGNDIALLYMRQMTASIADAFKSYFLRRQKQGRLRAMLPDVALMAICGMAQYYARCRYIHAFDEPRLSDDHAIDNFTQIAMNGLSVKLKARQR
jgi:hypothetical protein